MTNGRVLNSRPGQLVNFKVNCIMTRADRANMFSDADGALDAADT